METLHLKVNLSFRDLKSLVNQLSPKEKLKLNDVIWDDSMEIPVDHQKLVLQRIQKAKQSPKRMLDWDKAAKSLKP